VDNGWGVDGGAFKLNIFNRCTWCHKYAQTFGNQIINLKSSIVVTKKGSRFLPGEQASAAINA
jgi:hypothetical protein